MTDPNAGYPETPHRVLLSDVGRQADHDALHSLLVIVYLLAAAGAVCGLIVARIIW